MQGSQPQFLIITTGERLYYILGRLHVYYGPFLFTFMHLLYIFKNLIDFELFIIIVFVINKKLNFKQILENDGLNTFKLQKKKFFC